VIKTTKATDNQWLFVGVAGLLEASLLVIPVWGWLKREKPYHSVMFFRFPSLTDASI